MAPGTTRLVFTKSDVQLFTKCGSKFGTQCGAKLCAQFSEQLGAQIGTQCVAHIAHLGPQFGAQQYEALETWCTV